MATTLIKNGTIIDGTGKKSYRADVFVEKGRIVDIGYFRMAKTDSTVDASGCFVCPGFIDIQNHSDSYWTLLEEPLQESMLLQGITTLVGGQCGSSLAPLFSGEGLLAIRKWKHLASINVNWTTFAEFAQQLEQHSLGVHVASLVGHTTLRQALVSSSGRHLTKEEGEALAYAFRRSIHEGAYGLSAGFLYGHDAEIVEDEIVRLLVQVAHHELLFSVHLRSEGSHVLEALEETLDLALRTSVKTKISHFKIRGKQNWHLLERALHRIETAYQKGLRIIFDVYPYSSTWSVLYSYLPRWAYEGGEEYMLAALGDHHTRKRIIDYLKHQEYDFQSVRVATSETNPSLVGRSLGELSMRAEKSVEETLLDVLVACGGHAVVFDHNLSEEAVRTLLRHPLSVVSSDAAGYSLAGKSTSTLVHPRCFGAMPKFLRMVREEGLMPWEDAIKKLTGTPARILGLAGRGVLQVDAIADIVVFDPKTIRDSATFENPFESPEGVRFVMVKGELAVTDGVVTGKRAGQFIRRT